MTAAQVSAYAMEKGIDVAGCRTKADKVRAIEGAMADVEGVETIEVQAMGVTVEIAEDAVDDFDVVDWLGELQDGNIFVLPKLVRKLFGEDFARIRKELEDERGNLTATKAAEFFAEVLKEAGSKNS